ncbi:MULTISPECIES: structural protein [Providencia]|uniref:structural protein n=1 Tax=Providencia TaxID=586 RepID=UPI00234BF626|nr:structural protein [Providencia sp. PROV143]
MSNVPRGIRNNNAGNIRYGEKWQGLSPTQTDKDFCQFINPVWGIRALFKVLFTYQNKHHKKTIRQIIDRYAPPNENHTENYIQFVAKKLGVNADDEISVGDKTTLYALSEAIIKMENSNQHPYSVTQYDEAYRLL